ncbi:olfactory receptor 8I2-like [Pempheris klunzingeri]|uniref:olfactory receptor 8I2-like n=1 Tax=Pempheris klunzingeri TaxID=3127111 RepID=UPI003980D9D9
MGPEEKAANIFNATFVKPAEFYLSGFSNFPHENYYFVFLCFVYIFTLLGNGFLLSVIYMVEALHTPKYMIVSNLAVIDVCGSTALVPKLLDTFLFDRRFIVYEACLSYMFFVLFFASMQSWILVTMAYDRFIAICFPLRYHSIVTKPSISLNGIIAYVAFITVICIPFVLIALTYVCIFVALSRFGSGEDRLKALKTCTSHLFLVALLFLPITGTNIASVTSSIHTNARIINSSLTHTMPALLNPIVYSLKTEELRNSIKKICKRNRSRNTAFSKKVNSLSLL